MDCNGKDSKTKPLISSLKPQKEEIVERILVSEEEEDDDDESKRLLPPINGGMSKELPKTKRKVQWNDINGNNLAEILEFQPRWRGKQIQAWNLEVMLTKSDMDYCCPSAINLAGPRNKNVRKSHERFIASDEAALQNLTINRVHLTVPIIDSKLFKVLREQHGQSYAEFMWNKLVPITGDLCKPYLGMDTDSVNMIRNEVNVIAHMGGDTKWHDRYDNFLEFNVRSLTRLVDLAYECTKLALFVQVSSAYASQDIPGVAFEKPMDLGRYFIKDEHNMEFSVEKLINKEMSIISEIARQFHEGELAGEMMKLAMRRAKFYKMHNCYLLTKAIGELVSTKLTGKLPVVIIRPSLIESTLKEPFPGWVEGYKSLDPVILSYGAGELEGFVANPNTILDVVPVDMVVNVMVTAMAKHGNDGKHGVKIYNVTSSLLNPITCHEFFNFTTNYFMSKPLKDSNEKDIIVKDMKYFESMTEFTTIVGTNYTRNNAKLKNMLLRMAAIYEPILTAMGAWFDDKNTRNLLEEMSLEELDMFNFNFKCINWKDYFINIHIPGLTQHIIDSKLFKVLREQHGQLYDEFIWGKLVPVAGDICKPYLGMDSALAGFIKNEIDVIAHMSGDTKWHGRYDDVLESNVRALSRLVDFGLDCVKLALFVQLSSVYASNQDLPRVLFEEPIDLGRCFIEDEQKLGLSIEKIINTEMRIISEVARRFHKDEQDAEMIKLATRRALDPVILSYGMGQLEGFLANPTTVLDVVPVDMAINAMIAAMAKHGNEGKHGVNIYNVTSSLLNPISCLDFFNYSTNYFTTHPLKDSNDKDIIVKDMEFFGTMSEFTIIGLNATRFNAKLQSMLLRMAAIYEPIMTVVGAWFDDKNTRNLLGEMSLEELDMFNFNFKCIDWKDYFINIHIPGLTQHVLKKKSLAARL
ncbi:hypothetical protein KSS87_004949 [Heliosperma pusillum]|nr:hypothetical protein KSS87_004949 [Heliosperma pusillum]